MRGFIIALAVVLVAVAALGFYQGWFQFSTERMDHKMKMDVTVDEGKIQHDTQKARQEAQDAGRELKDKTKQGVRKLGRELQELGSHDESAPSHSGDHRDGNPSPK